MLEITSLILLIPVMLLVVISLSAIIIHAGNYKYYRRYYKLLPTFKWYQWQFFKPTIESENSMIIYFDDGSIKFPGEHYLHNYFPTYFDPYSLYWLIKYKKWFKKNVNINELEYN